MNKACSDPLDFETDRWTLGSRARKRSLGGGFTTFWAQSAPVRRAPISMPTVAYAKRSDHLHKLRTDSLLLARASFDEVSQPTAEAIAAAVTLINSLPDACLDFTLELSHDGEINFLYGGDHDLFHVHIGDAGELSFYSCLKGTEEFGDEIVAKAFPHERLLSFTERLS